MAGTDFKFSSAAACTRPWPAISSPASFISTGTRNPNVSILLAIWRIYCLEWVRALCAEAATALSFTVSMAIDPELLMPTLGSDNLLIDNTRRNSVT